MISPEAASELIDALRGVVQRSRAVAAGQQSAGALPPPLGALLTRIECSAGHRPSALAEELWVTQSALSRQVAQAEALGYVQRHPDPLDGRAALLSLTEAGAVALRRHREMRARWVHTALADCTEDEVGDLTARLDRFCAAIEAGANHPVAPAGR